MIKFCCIVLGFIFIIPLVIYRKKEFFYPIKVICIYNFITIIPYMWIVSNDLSKLSSYVTNHYIFTNPDMLFLKYTIIQIVGFLVNVFTISIVLRKGKYKKEVTNLSGNENKLALFCCVISTISYFLLMKKSGGIIYFLSNISKRASLLSGSSHFMMLYSLNVVSISIWIKLFYNKGKVIKKIFFAIYLFISIIGYTSFGGRNSTISLILLLVFLYNYFIKNVSLKFFAKKIYIPIFMCIYIIAIPILRSENGIKDFINNPIGIVNEVVNESSDIFSSISTLNQNLISVGYFNNNNYWYGKSYKDLLSSVIPRSIYPNKPPVDDGVYIWNIAIGYDVEVNTPMNMLHHSSWPLETLGNSYANFGISGVILGMTIMGIIQGKAYSSLCSSKRNKIFSILLYWLVMTNFQLINLKIFQISFKILLFYILFKVFNVYKGRNGYEKN